MDGEETYEAEDNPSSAAQLTELSQSSGVPSLPSGNKLAEISITTDISDSETESDDKCLFTSMKPLLAKNTGLPTLVDLGPDASGRSLASTDISTRSGEFHGTEKSIFKPLASLGTKAVKLKLNENEGRVGRDVPLSKGSHATETFPDNLSLGDVKVTLQENGNLLSDRGFLNELLRSIDEKIAEDIPMESQNLHQTGPPTRDPGPSLNWNGNSNLPVPKVEKEDLFLGPGYRSQERPDQRQKSYSSQKLSGTGEGYQGSDSISKSVLTRDESEQHLYSGDEPPPLDGILSQFGLKLTTTQRERQIPEKHVKFDSVNLELSSMSDSDGNSGRDRSETSAREETAEQPHMMKSAKILKELTNLRWTLSGWSSVETDPPTDHRSSLYFMQQLLNMLHTHQLQKKYAEEELLKSQSELKRVGKELYVLRKAQENREARLHEADSQLELIQKEWLGVHEKLQEEVQNNRCEVHQLRQERKALQEEVNLMKKDMTRMMGTIRVHEQSKVTLPEAQRELETARKKVNDLETALEQVVRDKAHLEDDLRLLRDQYKTLLERVVEEEDKKEQALKDKTKLERQAEDLAGKMATMKQELHDYYQARVEELVGQKSQSLQDQLNTLETNLKGSLEDQLDAQRKSHHHAVTSLQASHEEELKKIRASHVSQMTQLQQQIKALQAENQALQTQRQGIITAVSSILGPDKENQPGLLGNFHLSEVPWENGQISTSTPIGCGSASPLSERLLSTNAGAHYPLEQPHHKVFSSIESQTNGHFTIPVVRNIPNYAPLSKQSSGMRSASASRPTSGNSSRGKSSRNGSRPASGKSIRSGISIPDLGLGCSSSSDSDGSVFQEGKQTVRQVIGGSLSAISGDKHPESSERVRAWKSGSDKIFMPLKDGCSDKNTFLQSQADREYRSLPDLQMKAGHMGSFGEKSTIVESTMADHLPREYPSNIGFMNGSESANPSRRMHSQAASLKPIKQSYGKKIYKASEILQSSDITDDERMDQPVPNLSQVDQEMVRLLKELKKVRTDSTASESEPPTHDTSFDQDPASITLHKLSQVSTLLSQYVAQSPAS
ncbi:uncharacterized protein LOC122262190 isoform X2 [Penaeus japonicus]|uniref:uncharacterized protein LOC122262190 isoform X2 n=1 Tax=Penaeus japonicus TaxID=27405 RepID=UPI001C7147B2|nr:uncharacterized protein LOC122262190 isoform X2 [Penaeus japonicus]